MVNKAKILIQKFQCLKPKFLHKNQYFFVQKSAEFIFTVYKLFVLLSIYFINSNVYCIKYKFYKFQWSDIPATIEFHS